MYGEQFLEFCARVRSEGKYIRRVDVVGAGYVVRDVQPKQKAEISYAVRCAPAIAQLWFDILKAA